jgi:beta-carotene hydroxylase
MKMPTVAELGGDLLRLTAWQRVRTLMVPFACVGVYVGCAMRGWSVPAVVAVMYLSFATYGSISHDLVHRTLGLRAGVNDFFLTVIELLAFRSGHAYRLAHLHHHARFPHDDDVEGAAAKMPLWRALLEGVIFQYKLTWWALRRKHRGHGVVVMEVLAASGLLAVCVGSVVWTPVFCVYAVLMVMGAWAIPLVTSYLPHKAEGATALEQTKLFRGKVLSVIALEHLYHLEHHLYPMVPHHHWPELARRLDPYFVAEGIEPIVLGF